jgi:hypothetical protein
MESNGHACFEGLDVTPFFLKNQYIRLGKTDQWNQKKKDRKEFIHAKN